MKITIDVRHVAVAVLCLASGAGLHAFAGAPPPATPTPPAPPLQGASHAPPVQPGVTRWDFTCVSAKAAKIHEHAGLGAPHEILDDWNAYLKGMTDQGWEPSIFLTHGGLDISGVCLRRPMAARASAPEVPRPPAKAQGRCSLAQVVEMRGAGMSESAISAACAP